MSAFLRLAAWLLALGLVLTPVVALLNGWLASERWPIERLRINGEYLRVDEDAVRAAALPALSGGFFAVDLGRVREAVAGLPWVESAEVRKHWPDLVEITVLEHRAYARWGSDRLVSTRGVLFATPDQAALAELPQLEGPDSRLAEVLLMHRTIDALLAREQLRMRSLRLSPRGSWSLQLDDGARIMAGRGDPLPRLTRFAAALPRLLAVETRLLKRADLRYANGFSLRWVERPGPGTGDPGPGALASPSDRSRSSTFLDGGYAANSTSRRTRSPGPGSRVPGPGSWTSA